MEIISKDELLKPLFKMMGDAFKALCKPKDFSDFTLITIENQMDMVVMLADHFKNVDVIDDDECNRLKFMARDVLQRSSKIFK